MSVSTIPITIVIPVYNEEALLEEAVAELVNGLGTEFGEYELILAENGSRDGTARIARELARTYSQVRTLSTGEPNYGLALRRGIEAARGDVVVCDEIDLCDLNFYRRALPLLQGEAAQMVVGSKAMKGAFDNRPVFRRFATRVINGMLRAAVGFRGTDTHGLKAFRREAMVSIVERCVIDRDLFASELVVRAGLAGLQVVEIPVQVAEKRRPSVALLRRVPNVVKGLAHLTYVIRVKK